MAEVAEVGEVAQMVRSSSAELQSAMVSIKLSRGLSVA